MTQKNENIKRRNAFFIMADLIGLVKPLIHIMIAAVILGTAGYLCAIFLTILAGQVIIHGMTGGNTWLLAVPAGKLIAVMIIIAVLRGILHYAEQYCNHFIAFKLLAIIRHKVFAALRRLCPAKLEGKDKGNLISIITTDIELLEVFYAHTISPIAIAICTSLIMVIFIGQYNIAAGIFALSAYIIVGRMIPVYNGRCGKKTGMEFRNGFGELNSFVLDSLRGLDETIQYGYGNDRKAGMSDQSDKMSALQYKLSRLEGRQKSVTNLVILIASFGMLAFTVSLYDNGNIGVDGIITCTIAMMGSFGPVVALASLSNNLSQTLASGERVLALLEEEPLVQEIDTDKPLIVTKDFVGAKASDVSFAYEKENILNGYSAEFMPGKITGIHGQSGCGKSTLLKLLMRFWDVDKGMVSVDGKDVKKMPTKQLRNLESYVTQETHLFSDSIANNIGIAKPDAGINEIKEAAKKASIHDFIMTLPDGYDTKVGELGDTLSGGEKQRIGIARAFLHDSPLILMDEPTSNLDSLNEAIILKALRQSAEEKTIILVSHRTSTMSAADIVYEMGDR